MKGKVAVLPTPVSKRLLQFTGGWVAAIVGGIVGVIPGFCVGEPPFDPVWTEDRFPKMNQTEITNDRVIVTLMVTVTKG